MTALMTMEHAGGDETLVDEGNYSRRWWILAVLGIADSQLSVQRSVRLGQRGRVLLRRTLAGGKSSGCDVI